MLLKYSNSKTIHFKPNVTKINKKCNAVKRCTSDDCKKSDKYMWQKNNMTNLENHTISDSKHKIPLFVLPSNS